MFRFLGHKQVLFTATFFKDRALNRWHQHKYKIDTETLVPFTWIIFKVFLQKNLGETWVIIDHNGRKFYNASQYQLEKVIDWLTYIKYL